MDFVKANDLIIAEPKKYAFGRDCCGKLVLITNTDLLDDFDGSKYCYTVTSYGCEGCSEK